MSNEILFEGCNLEEALNKAGQEFDINADELDYELVEDLEDYCVIKIFLEDEEEQEEEHTSYYPVKDSMTDEELDEVADTAIDILRQILSYFDAQDAHIDEYEGDDGEIILDVVGEDLAVLIGRHGRTLDSLQALVVAATNKALGFRYPIVIDVESYRNRQRQKIENLALKAAARAIRQGYSVKLRPMTPYERRIVHITLRDNEKVETSSEGREPNRQVVVSPIK